MPELPQRVKLRGRNGKSSGLVRDRLLERLVDPAKFKVATVVAPAGSGKSSLLAQVAERYAGPVAWCGSPTGSLRSDEDLAGWLGDVFVDPAFEGEVVPDDRASDMCARSPVEGFYNRLEAVAGQYPVLLIAEDVHLLAASRWLDELIERLPAGVRLVVSSREALSVDVSGLAVAGELVEVDQEDLRFRTWEVEELFRDFYHEPLHPEEAASLARRSAGWAAYLQLFFLASARKPPSVRAEMLASLAGKPRLVSDYLGRHVLGNLDPSLADFLLRTSVLRRASPQSCASLTGCDPTEAEGKLCELERRRIFTERGADGAFRYHPVMVSYLDAKLVQSVGLSEARDLHRRAGKLLQQEGHYAESAQAYARAEDWASVSGLLAMLRRTTSPSRPGPSRNSLASSQMEAIEEMLFEEIPATLVSLDPLLLMARAGCWLRRGNLQGSVSDLRRAESLAMSEDLAAIAKQLRQAVEVWSQASPAAGSMPHELVRAASARQPERFRVAASALHGPIGRLAEALCALIGGDVLSARRLAGLARSDRSMPAWMAASAAVLYEVVFSFTHREVDDTGGGHSPRDVAEVLEEVERCGVPWLARVAAALLGAERMVPTERSLGELICACEADNDRWGAAVIEVVAAIRSIREGHPLTLRRLEAAAGTFGGLGAGTLQAHCEALRSLASLAAGDVEAAKVQAVGARTLAGLYGVPAASALASVVLATAQGDSGGPAQEVSLLRRFGLWRLVESALGAGFTDALSTDVHPQAGKASLGAAGGEDELLCPPASTVSRVLPVTMDFHARVEPTPAPAVPLVIRCFGAFAMEFDSRDFDESRAKPMERALLHLLASRVVRPVHREELIVSLWPDADLDSGKHRLQVAVSALRKLVDAFGGPASLIVRDGDAYRLSLPLGSHVDVISFEASVESARRARSAGDIEAEQDALRAAVEQYRGPLLETDGPAEWLLPARSRFQGLFCDACTRLAALLAARGDVTSAVEVARRGLDADRYNDRLWNVLVEALAGAGHAVEASKARREYSSLLDELAS